MDNEWSYIDFKKLMESILIGNTSVQEPITINNLSNSQTNNISFLTHLLKYDNITKDNLLENIFKIYEHFTHKIEELKKNKAIFEMMKRVNNEWYLNDSLSLSTPFNKTFFNSLNKIKSEYDDLCVNCREAILDSEKIKEHPLDRILHGEDMYQRELKGSNILCNRMLEKLKNNMEETEKLIVFFKGFNIPLYIDLSIKHRPLYFQLMQGDNNIPMNIHRIFSNFVHIHNLLFKQLIQHRQGLKDIISDVEKKNDDVNGRLANIQIIATMENEDKDKDSNEIVFNVGDQVLYKDDDIVKIIDINENVPEDEEPIIYIQFEDGRVRDVLMKDLTEIEEEGFLDDDDEDLLEDDEEKDNITTENARNISQKLIHSFFN